MTRYASVYPLVTARALAREFTYEIPDDIGPGAVVEVRFGNSKQRGVVTEVDVQPPKGIDTSPVERVVEELSRPKAVSLGAVYATLDRLEDKGLVRSWLSDPTPERGGRSKRHYRLESAGERALRESALTAKRICEAVEHVWGAHVWNPSQKWKPARQH